jgi:hypothetical protein
MEQGHFWETDSCLAGQQIPSHLLTPKVQNSMPLHPILGQMDPVEPLTLYSFKFHFNILTSVPMSPSDLLPLSFLTNIMYAFLISPPCVLVQIFSSALCS